MTCGFVSDQERKSEGSDGNAAAVTKIEISSRRLRASPEAGRPCSSLNPSPSSFPEADEEVQGLKEAEEKSQPANCVQRSTEDVPECPDEFLTSGSSVYGANPAVRSAQACQKKVRFEAQVITAIWAAESSKDYDRRSIVVDLSKTPFALFRKDAVLMKTTAVSGRPDPAAPLPRPTPGAALAANCAPDMKSGSSPETTSPPPSSQRRQELAGSWDSDASDSSAGHTDTETDLDQSDAEISPAQQRREERRPHGDGPAFYGVWKRTSSEGYKQLLLSSGVPRKAVETALRKHPVHIIDHDGTYFRLIVKNGLSKVDNTFFIGDEPRVDQIGDKMYDVSLNWAHLSGTGSQDELTLSSICHERGEEVVAIRSLSEDGTNMVLTQIVRRPAEHYEVRARHFFKRVTSKSELQTGGRAPSSKLVTVRMKRSPKTASAT